MNQNFKPFMQVLGQHLDGYGEALPLSEETATGGAHSFALSQQAGRGRGRQQHRVNGLVDTGPYGI